MTRVRIRKNRTAELIRGAFIVGSIIAAISKSKQNENNIIDIPYEVVESKLKK